MRNIVYGIIGCGLIGNKRALNLPKHSILKGCFDINQQKSIEFANRLNIKNFTKLIDILEDKSIDALIISTLHNSLADLSMKALKSGKHVFVEKPGAKNYMELEPIIEFVKSSNLKISIGFNHRYHRAILKAKDLILNNELGELMYIRGRYGHGGRIGYEKEWRSNYEFSGGGELIDQGPHLIDLSRLFLGDFSKINGVAQTFFWDMEVDDNAFLTLQNKKNQIAFLHVSCSEWKNMFSFEIFGKKGKLDISGLGGSYGIEKITFYKMLPEMGPPETYSWEFPMADNSWQIELDLFNQSILCNSSNNDSLIDAYEVLKIVNNIYKESNYDYCS